MASAMMKGDCDPLMLSYEPPYRTHHQEMSSFGYFTSYRRVSSALSPGPGLECQPDLSNDHHNDTSPLLSFDGCCDPLDAAGGRAMPSEDPLTESPGFRTASDCGLSYSGFPHEQHNQPALSYGSSQDSPRDFFEEEAFSNYQISHDYTINTQEACPRSFANGFDYNIVPEMLSSSLGGFPPSSYLMNPEKQPPYFSLVHQSPANTGSFPEQGRPTGPQLAPVERGAVLAVPPSPSASSSASVKSTDGPSRPQRRRRTGRKSLDTRAPDRNEADVDDHLPYAQLIHRALMSAPGHRMVLREIYDWFEQNTDKNKSPSQKGWQNSIRHNLSMNGAFRKVEQDCPSDDSKKGFVWHLEPRAAEEGVKSTTRYRKAGSSKKVAKADTSTPQRQVTQRKGRQASARGRSCTKRSRRILNRTETNMPAQLSPPRGTPLSVHSPTDRFEVMPSSNEFTSSPACYPYGYSSAMPTTQIAGTEAFPRLFPDVGDVGEDYSHGSLLCNSPEAGNDALTDDCYLDDSLEHALFGSEKAEV
ncbi:MAG: hypothetical protein M1817_003343 [Caeruleum heppii]|nr:MAG: hypothetical protein M1817_003343 [Caeruleum heppii]